MTTAKSSSAFLTIGELSARLGVPQHILRYWETRFPQLKPVQRAGNRRYYRPEDVALAERIQRLLGTEGYTVKGVQQLLARQGGEGAIAAPAPVVVSDGFDIAALVRIRDTLKAALAD